MDEENNGQEFSPQPPPPPAPEPAGGDEVLRLRMDRAEALIVELQRQAAEAPRAPAAPDGGKPARDPAVDQLAAAVDALKVRASREEELAARLQLAETALAGLKASFEGQRARLEGELDAAARKDSVEALRVNLVSALAALDEMKLNFAQYGDEVAAARSECRKALGEAQGLAKAAAQSQASGQLDGFVREAVGKMSARLAELETAMHAGLSELSARFSANEVLYGKMFSSAEERLKKGLEPQLKNMDAQLRWLRDNLLKLSDDYTVVAERKIRALEAKYSAFEAMARRLETIDAALKKSGKIGLP